MFRRVKLSSAFVRLPLRFDADLLAQEVAPFTEQEWRPHPQGFPGNSALPLVAVGGDPLDDATKGVMRPTPYLERMPYLRQVLAALGAPLGRSRLMRLEGDTEATAHVDVNYYWLNHTRVHVPIVTRPGVRFLCGPAEVFMTAGETWVFDTWRPHNVLNPGLLSRIHLVVDTVGSAPFWELVDSGEHTSGTDGLPPSGADVTAFHPGASPDLTFESVNYPAAMSPWELRHLVDLLLSEAVDPEAADTVRLTRLLEQTCRDWTAAWAVHGDAPEGLPALRELARRGLQRCAPLAGRVALRNGQDPVQILRNSVLGIAVNPELARPAQPTAASAPPPQQRAPAAVAASRPPAPPAPQSPDDAATLRRPVFIVSAPRSGSTLLFETLAQAPTLWSIGGESHETIEGIPALHPSQHGWESNRLTADDAAPEVVSELVRRFRLRLRDRAGRAPSRELEPITMLEKTPKNSLRVPFLADAFPDARFVFLYRDPVDTINSMIEAWRSKRFVTYPNLPGWTGSLPWSLLLVPGWRELVGRPVAEVAALQWRRTVEALLDDLGQLDPGRWCVASYGALISEPQSEMERLCAFLDIPWDRTLTAPLPPSSTTLTRPAPGKWKRNAAELEAVLPLVADVSERAREMFGIEPGPSRADSVASAPAESVDPADAAERVPTAAVPTPSTGGGTEPPPDFSSSHTESFPALLKALSSSLLVSTYQSGRLIAFREDEGRLNTHFRSFDSPMGLALKNGRLAIGTRREIWEYRDQPAVANRLEPPGKHDGVFLPRKCHITGDVRIHEVAYAGDELWFISTLFSCLATLDAEHSFVPRWRPPFISALAPEDRCHLNGFCAVDGRIRFVTALGETDQAEGWRDDKAAGGILIDVESGQTVARGLSMPHSPRWHDGRLWVLESGKGSLATVDLDTGARETVAEVPGFSRGLSFAGPYAFVGLSQVRESVFRGLPIMNRNDRASGVWVIDVRTGSTVAFLRFDGIVQEIFDVQVMPGFRFPEIGEPGSAVTGSSFVLPDEALQQVPVGIRSSS